MTGSTDISRREAIRRAVLLAGVVVSPAWLDVIDRARGEAQALSLTTARLSLVTAIAERILPRTDTPGATDVGVPASIDRLYGQFMTDAERAMLTAGLDEVERTTAAARGAGFVGLSGADQDTILRGIAKAEEGRDQGFFRLFRSAAILGYFSSETVGRTVLHYEPVPGRYDACVPISDVGNRNWTT